MDPQRLINILVPITLIEMMIAIGLGVAAGGCSCGRGWPITPAVSRQSLPKLEYGRQRTG
ncbi:MAG TPA: hypothetical protein VGI81_11230 [Tepidisphaeraceae bacterium]|jgi:hypothetical protein